MCPFSIYLLIDGPSNQALAAKLNQLLQKQYKSLAVKYTIPFEFQCKDYKKFKHIELLEAIDF